MWNFFENIDTFQNIATAMDTDVNFIMAISSLETGWMTSLAYLASNNPFGASDANEKPLAYGSVQEAVTKWIERWGPRVQRERDANKFFEKLVGPKGGLQYNPHGGYAEALVNQVDTIKAWRVKCDH